MDVKEAEEILPRLEQSHAAVEPRDCVGLFVAVARLRFTNWDFVEILWTPERRKRVGEATTRLYQRLADALGRHREEIMEGLEEGIRHQAASVRRNLRNRHYRGEPDEFSSEVLFPYEDLAYVRLLLDSLGLKVSAAVRKRLESLDAKMRDSLPEIARAFRESGNPIDPIEPRMYPDSFWWMRLSPSPPEWD